MAKLQKGLGDYFRIPILLKPIGSTPMESVTKLHQILSKQQRCLIVDDRYQPLKTAHSKLLQKRQKNAPQTLKFMIRDFVSEWNQFEVIYRCRFCVGVFDCKTGSIAQEWKKMSKICSQENRKLVGLIILTMDNCNVQGIKQPSIIIPQKLQPAAYFQFLQPWYFAILPTMEDYICYLISQLQKDDNGFIVFNKIQQKPQPRTLKKKKKGRCLKICGDFCLILHLVNQGYRFYVQAEDILKKVDDYLWALGCSQGKLACFTTDATIDGVNKSNALQQTRVQCLNLAKKMKVPQLQTQNYFKILKIYTKITQSFDQMARDFVSYVLSNYSNSQKFCILTQLAMLYKQAGMIRKHNYMLYLSARLAIDLKPSLVGILLNQILSSGHVKQWPLVNANVIKLLIDNTLDSKEGLLHLGLLQDCCSVLTERDVAVTIQALENRSFHQVVMKESKIFDIVTVTCKQSEIKPKNNNLAVDSPVKQGPGFFVNWRKKQTIYKFQQQEEATFQLKIRNNMSFIVRCTICLHFSDNQKTSYHSFHLQPKMNKVTIKHKFQHLSSSLSLSQIQLKFFNFTYLISSQNLPSIKLQIYEEYPSFQIQAPQTFANQQSSLFQFPLLITRTKPYLKMAKIGLTISVYYNVQVGFQEIFYNVYNLEQKQKYIVVLHDYPYAQSMDQNTKLVRLDQLKANKKHLKKIQCRIDAIATESSKYQISKQCSSAIVFERSIWCELLSICNPLQIKFGCKEDKIIQEYFVVNITANKMVDDLTPYKITSSQVSYILSESTTVIIEKKLKKINKNSQNSDKPVQILLDWCNSTRQKQCGSIVFQIAPEPIMFLSDKKIQFNVEGWNKQEKQELKSPVELSISYEITSQCTDLSHSLVVQPRNLPAIKKYIVAGKTKMKPKLKQNKKNEQVRIKNQLKVKFFYEYAQEYMIGLKFQDGQVYWFPCLFTITQ